MLKNVSQHLVVKCQVRVIVFNAIFNNISAISWQSVLLVEETRLPWENHRPVTSHWHILSHNVASSTPHHEWDSNSQLKWWYALIAQVGVNPSTLRSQPRWPCGVSKKKHWSGYLSMHGCQFNYAKFSF